MIDAFSQLTETKIPDSLTGKEVNQLRKLVAKGRLTKAYDNLAERGYQYAILANGVVKGDSFAGRVALEYLEKVAEEQSVAFAEEQLDAVRQAMADVYLKTLAQQINDTQAKVSRDILADEAWQFHSEVFASQGFAANAWTLHLPFTVMATEARDLYWAATLNSAGDFNKEILLGIAVDFIVKQAAINIFEPGQAHEAIAWLHRLHNLDTYAIAFDAKKSHLESLAANIPASLFNNVKDGVAFTAVRSVITYLNSIISDAPLVPQSVK